MKKRTLNYLSMMFVVLMLALAGCGGGGSESDVANPNAEDIFSAGYPVPAVKAIDAATLSLYVKGTGGTFSQVVNGSNMLPGTYTFGVKAVGGSFGRGRVFIADGGGKQVEALLSAGYYTCLFKLGDSMTCPILIQEIYENGLASKEKVSVFTVSADKFAEIDELVRNGIAMVLGQDMMDSVTSALVPVLNNMISAKTFSLLKDVVTGMNVFAPKDGGRGFASASISVKNLFPFLPDIPLRSNDLILTDTDSKGNRKLTVGFETPILSYIGIKDLALSLDPLSFDLAPYGISKKVFLNAYGDSENFPGSIGLHSSLFLGSSLKDATEFPVPAEMDNAMITPDGTYNLGVGISQYNINQILTPFVNGMTPLAISDTAILDQVKFAIPGIKSGTAQALSIDMSKALVALDCIRSTPRIFANDVRASYTENGKALWTMSLDLVIDLSISSKRSGSDVLLNLSLVPVTDLCHTHLMMDNTGNLGIFDHSKFVVALVDGLAGKFSEMNVSELLGTMVQLKGTSPIKVESKDGYLYLNLAAESLDLSGLVK